MSRLIWSPDALLDVKRLHDFLKPKDLDAAKRALKAIRQGVKVLALTAGRVVAQERLQLITKKIQEQARLNKAFRSNRVPRVVARVLRELDRAGLHERFTVIGTQALYALVLFVLFVLFALDSLGLVPGRVVGGGAGYAADRIVDGLGV